MPAIGGVPFAAVAPSHALGTDRHALVTVCDTRVCFRALGWELEGGAGRPITHP